ncbi:MAG TPA: WYL domain-containing protein [Acidimicrobiia bacterium]
MARSPRHDGFDAVSPRPLAAERLRRVLALVPWILSHPDEQLDDLAARFNMSRRDLERELSLLQFCGLPPYTADRLIDVDLRGDRVSIRLAEYFERPLRLTPAEGFALLAAGRGLLAMPGSDPTGPLARALEKLAAALGSTRGLAVDVGGAPFLDVLRDAAQEGEQVELDYYSYARDEMTTRRVDPMRVFHAFGAWYVGGYCHRAEGERLFRVDRVRAVRPTGVRFEPPSSPLSPDDLVYHPRSDDLRITLRLDASARWVAEAYPTEDVVEEKGGGQRVTLAISEQAWLDRLLLRVGPAATVLDPPAERDAARRAAARVLARYRPGAGDGAPG